ncbi:hypothetical protein A2U01_0015077, partial [Trifolium medium]|nr:hypothetical protein [Trifolium medium]
KIFSNSEMLVCQLKDEEGCLLGVSTSNLLIANSGNDLPGRGIETNLYAQFKCDSMKIAMVKHPEVAEFLGSRMYDCLIKYNEV